MKGARRLSESFSAITLSAVVLPLPLPPANRVRGAKSARENSRRESAKKGYMDP